ncbi:hypothetical protein [Mesorhizobium sp. B2-7-1]|uniref:hypothetical protein n=1 Tax=Mesorhizobium sp. B2-7-1 TaxID=2589909 RepID=UPI00112ED57C|nr:hypothetical protein [Mesorhizobium sp. B2-7-1]TPJ46846.1 hypothetical protein FJ471_31425 [Mesorhizobium sp. B2-7-1]
MVDRTLPAPPPELAEIIEASRKGFRAQFGSFDEALVSGYALGTSEDGGRLGFQIVMPDGSVHRFALRADWVPQFIIELAGATDDMNQHRLAAGLAAAEPRGQA